MVDHVRYDKFVPMFITDDIGTKSASSSVDLIFGRRGEELNHDLVSWPLDSETNIHALITAKSGNGMLSFINTVVCNLCWYYSADELDITVVDFKCMDFDAFLWRSVSKGFKNISNVHYIYDGDDLLEAISDIENENRRRIETIFSKGVNTAVEYNKLIGAKPGDKDFLKRHVIIISNAQDFSKYNSSDIGTGVDEALTCILKVSRSLGVNVIFCATDDEWFERSGLSGNISTRGTLSYIEDGSDGTACITADVSSIDGKRKECGVCVPYMPAEQVAEISHLLIEKYGEATHAD